MFLYELWPLTVGELAPYYGGAFCPRPLIVRLLENPEAFREILEAEAAGRVGPDVGAAESAVHHILTWGGLPALLRYPPAEREQWLDGYQATYLERDLADLARLRDLESFAVCHRLAALRAAKLLSYSDLARDAALSVATTRRYLRYLELSYQTLPLPAWSGNESVRLIKSPKLTWVDLGVQRILSGQLRELTGEQYESAMTSQIYITLRNAGVRAEASFLRTSNRLEVDLVLEPQGALLAIEMKARAEASARDAMSVEIARRIFGPRYRGGIVLYRGRSVTRLTDSVWAVPDWLLLGF